MVIPVQATVTSSWLSTTPVVQSSGRSSLGHRVGIMLMELPPTHPETSMCQETPMEDWMVIPVQAALTSSWLSTTPVVQRNGRSSWGHQVVIMIIELPPTHPETSMCQETHKEDWMVIPVQATLTSSWLSTTPVGQSSEIGH